MNKIIDLAKKLKALADRGEGGEKANAQQMLQKLMAAHGLTIADIEARQQETRWFKVTREQGKVFAQVVVSIMGVNTDFWQSKGKKNHTGVKCDAAEYIEIQAAFEFFWNAYQKEMKLFFKAFVYRNDLLPKDAEESATTTDPEELEKLINLMKGIDKSNFRKQLNH